MSLAQRQQQQPPEQSTEQETTPRLTSQSAEWRTRCLELLDERRKRGIEDVARLHGEEREDHWDPDVTVIRWSVASGNVAKRVYTVSEARCSDRVIHMAFHAFQCDCRAGTYEHPCGHVGVVIETEGGVL